MKDRKLSSPHPQRKVQLLNLQRGEKTVLSVGDASVGQEAQWKHSGHIVKPASRAQRLDKNYCALEKDLSKKNATLWRKNLPKQLKNEKCWKIVTEESKRLLPKITLPANDAVITITEIILFAVIRWKSASQYFSDEAPDEAPRAEEQNKSIRNIAATKLEQEPRSQEAGF